jgi:hypothetical protein
MSTEFNTSGFDAVSSFFGDAKETNQVEIKKNDLRKSTANKKRLGVGMKATKDDKDIGAVESLAAKEKILSIGKKRRYNDESDEADHDADESSDDEGGRTSVVKDKTLQSNAITEVDIEMRKKPNKKKKKKGKKERMAEKLDESESCNQKQIPQEIQDVVEYNLETEEATGDTSDAVYQKKKRRKTRSKQKNVRKDTRSSQEKPEHLRIGSKIYAGRALTQETRMRLNLPESRTSLIRKERAMGKIHPSSEEQIPSSHLGLAVDDLLADNEDGDIGGIIDDSGELVDNGDIEKNPTQSKIPKQKRKKKSKYKNLK